MEEQTKILEINAIEVENEVNARTGEPTATWRGTDLDADAFVFGASIGFASDSGYSVEALRDRAKGFVDDFVISATAGERDRGGRPLFESLPDFDPDNELVVMIAVRKRGLRGS